MPTYEFACPAGHEFERFFRKMSDAPTEVACPECGKPAARQLSGGAGLIFKGSGFYITDYGKDGKKLEQAPKEAAGEKKTEGSAASSDQSSGGSSSAAKPAGGSGETSKSDTSSKKKGSDSAE